MIGGVIMIVFAVVAFFLVPKGTTTGGKVIHSRCRARWPCVHWQTVFTTCADIDSRREDTSRRLCNQAFFTKVHIDEDDELCAEHNRTFEMMLVPQVNALIWAVDIDKDLSLFA